jgi:hypothetical protein
MAAIVGITDQVNRCSKRPQETHQGEQSAISLVSVVWVFSSVGRDGSFYKDFGPLQKEKNRGFVTLDYHHGCFAKDKI